MKTIARHFWAKKILMRTKNWLQLNFFLNQHKNFVLTSNLSNDTTLSMKIRLSYNFFHFKFSLLKLKLWLKYESKCLLFGSRVPIFIKVIRSFGFSWHLHQKFQIAKKPKRSSSLSNYDIFYQNITNTGYYLCKVIYLVFP